MKSYRRLNEHSFLLVILIALVALLSSGCSSSTASSDGQVNPLGAYQITDTTVSGTPTSGTITNVGAIDSPIVSTPVGDTGVDGHTNAPLLSNMHPGWQQGDCLSCHNDTTRNPDHNYTNDQQCYLCHGTNGLPGFGDDIPPVISGVVANPAINSVVISWKSDEESLSRLILRTTEGDKMEFPVGSVYSKTHKYTVTGLIDDKAYTYELICTDRNGNKTTSATFGQLSFTTLPMTEISDDSTSTSTEVTDTFFSAMDVTNDGSYAVSYDLTVERASKVVMYIVVSDSSELLEAVDLYSIDGNPLVYRDSGGELAQDTSYKIYFTAIETVSGVRHTSAIYRIKTDAFGG